ncbi:LysE family transporter [Lutibacter sp. TH_r2]|uniref:LysE family translocator n=1 Tax=Lutibacter sp. TH_r2 TaxID=3082083 RepID=UPI0029558BA8|nr:LysE family transporter [Lutibacter sp. TH_r2]MDV7185649.1 LysE family transporter [Lutibacter sp. TH_r2]
MIYLLHVFYGILMSYIGFISPGMINMASLKISLNKGRKQGLLFAFGASLIVFIQSGIALFFADYFVQNPQIVSYLKIAGVVVFFLLAIVFFVQAKRKINSLKEKDKNRYFLKGIGMSLINMLAIPFYLAVSIFLASEGKIIIEQPYILLFVFGASLGAFLLFSTYIAFANFISTRIAFIAKNINYILSGLFLVLGISTLYKLLV